MDRITGSRIRRVTATAEVCFAGLTRGSNITGTAFDVVLA